MKFIPIGNMNHQMQCNLSKQIKKQIINFTYTELLRGSNYGHKAIK